jgi:hypothetical protein
MKGSVNFLDLLYHLDRKILGFFPSFIFLVIGTLDTPASSKNTKWFSEIKGTAQETLKKS